MSIKDSLNTSELGFERKHEWKEVEQRRRRQIEDSVEEGDVVDWYEDDELRKQWDGVSKEEGNYVAKKIRRRCSAF